MKILKFKNWKLLDQVDVSDEVFLSGRMYKQKIDLKNLHIYRTLKLAVGSSTVVQHSAHNYKIECYNPAADIRWEMTKS